MGLTNQQIILKRLFDLILSFIIIFLLWWLILLLGLFSSMFIGGNGFFKQKRIGKNANVFLIYKIKSISDKGLITSFGEFLRKTKLDELPQLINIIKGDMSFVGPRPDIPGYADKLVGEDRIILLVRPGITSPASIYFKNEEKLLKKQSNPKKYNDEVIWPQKVAMNVEYVKNYSFLNDLVCLVKTVI